MLKLKIYKEKQPRKSMEMLKEAEKDQQRLIKYKKPRVSPLDIQPEKISVFFSK